MRKHRTAGIAVHDSERPTLPLVVQLGSHNLSCTGGSGLAHKTVDRNAFLRGAIRRLEALHQPATAAPVRGGRGPDPGRSHDASSVPGAGAPPPADSRPAGTLAGSACGGTRSYGSRPP